MLEYSLIVQELLKSLHSAYCFNNSEISTSIQMHGLNRNVTFMVPCSIKHRNNRTLTCLSLYSYSGTADFFLYLMNTSSQFRVICIQVLFLVGFHCSYCFSVFQRGFVELQSNGTNSYLSSIEGLYPQSPLHFA